MKTKVRITKEQEVDLKTLIVKARVRYWEDGIVNGIEDSDGSLIPCRKGDIWCPVIDIDSGIITNWEKGKTAKIHYKVCDSGSYYVHDEKVNLVLEIEGDYVPKIMCPKDKGYGDYIIMDIDANGKIAGWKPTFDEFQADEE